MKVYKKKINDRRIFCAKMKDSVGQDCWVCIFKYDCDCLTLFAWPSSLKELSTPAWFLPGATTFHVCEFCRENNQKTDIVFTDGKIDLFFVKVELPFFIEFAKHLPEDMLRIVKKGLLKLV